MDKVCVNHPESPSVGACKACEKPVCLMCIVEVAGVSFCSEACGSAYQEVKDWLERPAADEEWNPLAEAKAKGDAEAQQPAVVVPEDPSSSENPPTDSLMKTSPTGTEMRAALSTAFGENALKPADPIPQVPGPEPQPSGNRNSLYIAIAATVLIIIGIVVLFNSGNDSATKPPPDLAKVEPPKPEPPKPEPVKVEPPKPEIKPEPPKPKPEPPKPEIKPEPPKPKPEPVKPEPPKPEVKPEPPKPKPEPPKPEIKPEPPKPKPEPVKPEPPKPEPVKPEPPKPKPEPVKPEPPKPEPVKPEIAKPEPPPAPHLAFLRDPWGKEKPGAWYRIKTTAGGQDSYRDVGLRESGAGYRVLVSQTNAAGKTEPEQFTWTEPEDVVALGSVNGDAQGTKYAADVVRLRASRPSQYVFRDAPHAGASFPSDAVLTRLAVETLKVKDRSISCTVMETEQSAPKRSLRTWYSTQIPLGAVKAVSDASTSVVIDLGDDWSKRPPFPEAPLIAKVDPPKPEPVKPEPVKPEPPKPEPVKPEPPKPEPIKPEPPKPEPIKPPPPKPEPVKPEPPKPEPVKPEPPKPEPVKPPPPKPEPVKPEPPKPEPVKPEPPKPEPVKPEVKPEAPRKEEASSRVKKSLADAAGLIREATPMYLEVAGAMESMPSDKALLQELVGKAEKVQLKLGDARVLYTNVKAEAPDPLVLDRRLTQIDELLGSVQQCLKQLKSRLQ